MQRVVTVFQTAEASSPIEIHRRLRSVYGEDAIDVTSVRHGAHRYKSGGKDISDKPLNGRPALVATTEIRDKVYALIRYDSSITTSEL
jgi:hypothetical protein